MDKFSMPKENVKFILLGLAVIVVGFLCMLGGGSNDPDVFNPAIFSTLRITVAPILIIIGFAIEFYAVMRKPRK